ncbi:MAG: glycosyltransferase family 9 protein [Candidatus Latescibacteria bacterium]|jgi:heptosyltransferase III|nr:glycosyltransferase family 9 protein [Candidatus Latescibacterota bacterium]
MNILLIRTGGLGDSLLTLPVAHTIKKIHSDMKFHILGNEMMLSVARLSGIFDRYHYIDTGGFYKIFSDSAPSEFLRSFFSKFDIVYFFTTAPEKEIKKTIIDSGARNCHVLDPRKPNNLKGHIADHLMTILGESHISPPLAISTEFTIDQSLTRKRSGVLIHPGSGSRSKNWPLKNFIRLAESVTSQVSFLLGPAEIERGMEKDILSEVFHVIKTESLSELLQVLSEAELYVGNDSGVSHLAAMCGTPCVVLFGATDPAVWRPVGRDVTIVPSGNGLMNGISIEEVLNVVIEKVLIQAT